ncbi:DNA-binding NarL/FixJ family response regulator [Geodermatophilus normandii]|uniref:DNA-binding NarL/FixJ family response regulator n=1 Tax=Geodermatophilus normandii TaxID=1137989 RepID=A0A317QRD8_9ACTN|nr:LuxR family transcriptional regulator [Geodermatophilus normandii]PWW24270.1 DNA-binding NarL/FixJ family response regulator [Geodermatophilus normandii]
MLVGRDPERAAVAILLDGARAGTGGALVVRGVAGAGKSTLLADAVANASDMTVLRTSGVESESPLAFAALQRLLWPLRSRLTALPAPQRAALAAALGEAAGEGERFLAFLGTLSLLADAAERTPVLAVVDDAHWLDDASAAALLFAARRLQVERVAVLFAARDGDTRSFDAPDLPTVVLGGVAGADADAVLRARAGGAIDPEVRDRLVAATGGNPLALVELAGVLTAASLAGRAPLPAQLPSTGGVERGFLDRYRRLGESAQRFLLVAAADDTGRLAVVRDAAERLGAGDDALDEVERAGLLTVDGDALTLYHPLVRSAVYRAATSARRRAAHRALAAAVGTDADRRAWHLAAAADRPDEAVVAALDAVAERAAARGGHEAAADAWARAAELTPGGEARGRRLYLAASSAWSGAHPSRAAALATAAEAEALDPRVRARLLLLQGQLEWNTRSLDDGHDLVLRAAEVAAGVDRAMAQELAMLAASLSACGARSARAVDLVTLVPAPEPDAAPRVRAARALMRGFLAADRGDWAAAAESFRCAFALTDDDPVDDHVLQPNLGVATWLVDDDERDLRLHEQQLTGARRAGALSMVEHALTRGAPVQIATGAWGKAAAAAAEALPLTAATGHVGLTALPIAELALVAAMRGDDGVDRHLAEVTAVREAHPVGISDFLVVDMAHWARGLRAAGRPATALHHLAQIASPRLRRMAAIDRLETAARADRADLLRAWLAELEDFAAGTGAPAAVAVVEHGHALLAGDGEAEAHFRRALAAHAASLRLPDRARTELAYGEHLRRARRRVDAREHLRTALVLFEDLGATPWAERAAQELRASGETARRRDVSTATDLTAQERQVAALVRQGLSNRDVAAQLFVSPRTVDFHLRNVFSKLGVSSRTELTALPLDL